jgi:inhibitor of cysteine peptidase
MKKKSLGIVVFFVLLSVLGGIMLGFGCTAKEAEITSDTFTTSVGKTFTFVLDANATTGYSWSQKIKDTNVVAYVTNLYATKASAPQIVGSGGTDTFTFKAVGKGTTTITLTYARTWETTAPMQTRTVTITVK